MNKGNNIDVPTPSDDPKKVMIEDYKKHIRKKELQDEKYKWELVEEFRGRPNLDAENLHEEMKSINYSNLLYPMSKAVMNDLTEKKPEETHELLEMLFDESLDLAIRIKDFSKGTKELYRALGETNQHHQDERAISVYLTYKYPKKHTFYKYSFYNYYCELLNVAKAKVNERYTHYLSLIDELIEQYIIPDVELIEQVKSYIPQYYDGTNHKLLAQDILFQMERRNAKENYWVFQGNPDKYDFETAFREDDISAWTVTSHKNRIKPGDKVIIWVTGSKAGCYALAEVASKPLDRASFPESHLWRVDDTSELKAAINITHNFANNPILKDEIDGITDLEKLNVGHQGTNFTATKEEYEILLELAVEREDEKRYWLYSPGEQARNWEEFYNDGIMGLGWDKLEDLNNYESKEEIKEALDNAYGGDGSKKNNTTANDEFANVMKVGDVVIAKRGLYELLGYGEVTSDYVFDNNREEYKHIRKVDWKLNGSWKVGFQLVQKTLTDITPYETEDPNYNWYYERLLGIMKGENEPGDDIIIKMEYPTNTILYGPPGTGKTYNTINEALKIIDNDFLEKNIDNRAVLNERFRSLRFNPATGEGQIAFITFHQSLSYEDFIEGIKPKKNDGEESISYEVCDGLFKSIAIKASDKKVVVSFDEIYQKFISDVMEQETFSLETPVQKKPFDVRINGSGNCVAIPQTETATQMVVTKKMISDFLVDGTVRDWKPYLSSIAEHIKTNYEYKVDREDNADKPYIIIIDEINRGNISQIFGELITLIEPDKRKGQAEEIEVILPYSEERFSVPSNLHIIGTMNTADRSVEALDTALRRRFSFMEMNPQPTLLSNEEFRCQGIDLEAMLKAINGRIEKLLDKDYCIGHSYFMTIKNKQEPLEELKLIFQNKIMPLLQEYFYGDWGKIRLIVGQGFVEMKVSNGVKFLDEDSVDGYEEYDERPIFNFTCCEGWTLETFKGIYETEK